jgi:hypothetical protein
MADGAAYPAAIIDENGKQSAGNIIQFLDDSDQPSSSVIQSPTDPGAVGAGALWVNTTGITGTSDLPLSVRDPSNSFWSPVGLAHYDGTGQLRGFVTLSDSAIVIEKWDSDGTIMAYFLIADDRVYISTEQLPIWISSHALGGTTWGLSAPSGAEKFGGLSETPDDSEVVASQQIVWFDPTSGAAATRFKNQDVDTNPTSGQLAALSDDGTHLLQGAIIQWVTVQDAPPTTYLTPLVFDTTAVTGGLYAWDGSAYQQVGGPLA